MVILDQLNQVVREQENHKPGWVQGGEKIKLVWGMQNQETSSGLFFDK